LVDGEPFGNPLSYTTKRLRTIEETLSAQGFRVSHRVIGDIVKNIGYRLQKNKQCLQVRPENPERNKQCQYINGKTKQFREHGQPVIRRHQEQRADGQCSKQRGRIPKEKDTASRVGSRLYDTELGKVSPSGLYDVTGNEGFVNCGTSKDTAECVVQRRALWGETRGNNTYPDAGR
jgi:hypothetical protein